MSLPEYLSTRAASEYLRSLGIDIAANTLARWRCTGRRRLPYHRIGAIVRYRRADLDAFVAEHRVEPDEAA